MAKRPVKKSNDANDAHADGATGRGTRRPSKAALRKLDEQIVDLLNQRAHLTVEGRDDAEGEPTVAGDAAALSAAVTANQGPLPARAVQAVFRELLSGIRAIGGPVRVAYLGPELTYSHLAAIARFGHSAELIPVASIATVFAEVERSQADFGVVPIENSTDGRVADTLECFGRVHELHQGDAPPVKTTPNSNIQICAEAPLRIHHCLLGRGRRADVRRILSKPQALSQCRNWLSAHLPDAALVEAASTGAAAHLAATEPGTAAIAGEQAAANYGLDVMARHIEDNPDNVTRFAVIGRHAAERSGKDKTSLAFEAPHKPGALADAMTIFKRQRLNLTWIESFPIPRARGRYLFFVEFQGHPSELRARRAIAALSKKSLRLVVLGSYAEAEVIG
jgi:chorismate mutase / prephenate dehydratase